MTLILLCGVDFDIASFAKKSAFTTRDFQDGETQSNYYNHRWLLVRFMNKMFFSQVGASCMFRHWVKRTPSLTKWNVGDDKIYTKRLNWRISADCKTIVNNLWQQVMIYDMRARWLGKVETARGTVDSCKTWEFFWISLINLTINFIERHLGIVLVAYYNRRSIITIIEKVMNV